MFVVLISLLLFSPLSQAAVPFEETPFYSVPVDDIDLSQIKIDYEPKSGVLFEKKAKKEFALSIGKDYRPYFDNVSDYNKKVVAKLASLGIMKDPMSFKTTPYSLLYKKDHAYNLETFAVIPMRYKEALKVIKDFANYNNWVLKDVNVRRNGEKGKYFVDVLSLTYLPDKKWYDTRVKMNSLFTGNYRLDLLVIDNLDDVKNPNFELRMREPSRLAKDVHGVFYFIVPTEDQPYCLLYFTGRSEVHWVIYKFLPLAVIQTQVMERIHTFLENIQFKVEQEKNNRKK
jgi:hypothetical protein